MLYVSGDVIIYCIIDLRLCAISELHDFSPFVSQGGLCHWELTQRLRVPSYHGKSHVRTSGGYPLGLQAIVHAALHGPIA